MIIAFLNILISAIIIFIIITVTITTVFVVIIVGDHGERCRRGWPPMGVGGQDRPLLGGLSRVATG